MGAAAKGMQRGVVHALGALFSNMFVMSFAMASPADESHRLYDRQTDCVVFDIAAFSADKATWDGPCTHGLASGRGTATFLGRLGGSETVSAEFHNGVLVDGKAEIAWNDGAHYLGMAVDGRPDGTGTLVDAKGNRFDGEWKDGALKGQGSVVWTNGDRYEGDWIVGKAEGHGVQVWADGQKYDGQWHNDRPNGQGTLTHKDGTSVAGSFVDGKRQVAVVAPPPASTAPATPNAPASDTPLFDSLAGRLLVGVDGSSVAFAAREGAMVRTMTAPDGTVQRAAFTFLGKGLGTISDGGDPPQVNGVFRTTPNGIEAEFSDGHLEELTPLADGLAITLESASGEQSCAAWYMYSAPRSARPPWPPMPASWDWRKQRSLWCIRPARFR